MKYLNKKILIVFAGLLFTFCAKNALAQYPGMRAVYAKMDMQRMQQQMNMQMMMMANLNGNNAYNRKYTFTVTFKDSSTKQIKSRFYRDTTVKKNYLLFVDKSYPRSDSNRNKKIYPSQTINISREIVTEIVSVDRRGGKVRSIAFNGIPSDSCWMFKVVSGPINAYSYLSETDEFTSPESMVGIQLDGGPIVKCDADNLKKMVGIDSDALKQINKKNYYKAIKKYNRNIEKAKNK